MNLHWGRRVPPCQEVKLKGPGLDRTTPLGQEAKHKGLHLGQKAHPCLEVERTELHLRREKTLCLESQHKGPLRRTGNCQRKRGNRHRPYHQRGSHLRSKTEAGSEKISGDMEKYGDQVS